MDSDGLVRGQRVGSAFEGQLGRTGDVSSSILLVAGSLPMVIDLR